VLSIMLAKTHTYSPRQRRNDDSTCDRSSYPGPGRLLFFLVVLAATASVVTGSALARTARLHQSTFGSFPPFQTAGAATIDQSTGDVYVATKIPGGGNTPFYVSRFTAAGAQDNFTAGPDAGTNTLTTGGENLTDLAVDNSPGPLHGDIYVDERDTVKLFASDGSLLGALDGSGTPDGDFGSSACGVAVDATSGDVYVAVGQSPADNQSRIWRYAPGSPSGTISDGDYTVTGIKPDHPVCRLAVDEASGHLYGSDAGAGTALALLLYPTSAFAPAPVPVGASAQLDQPVTAVALDAGTGQVYADEGNRVSVFDSAGSLLYHFGYAADFGPNSQGIAVTSGGSGSASAVYVTDFVDKQIAVFGATTQVVQFTHPDLGRFGTDGTESSVFSHLAGLAFNQADRALFAVDNGGAVDIYGFDASAPPPLSPLAGFTPLSIGSPANDVGLGIDNSGASSAGSLYLANGSGDPFTGGGDGLIDGFDPSGNPLGGNFPIDPATTPGSPAGSPKDLCAAAVDSAGDIFVVNGATQKVLEYSSAGAFLTSIDTSAQGFRGCHIAEAPNDDLYVSMTSGVWRYSAASGYTSAIRVTLGFVNGSPSPPIAVDPSNGDLFVAAMDITDTTLPPRAWIDEYDSSGNLLDEFDPGVAPEAFITGITVDPGNHDLYVTDDTNQVIRVIGPGVIRPEASVSSASTLANTSATLDGSVNTQGVALSDCHFEYVTEAAYRLTGFSDLSSGGNTPCDPAAGSIPTDLNDHPVTGLATGLTRNTDYRFRLSATNASGATVSSDVGFTTAGPPIVETVGSPRRTATTVRLDSRVDPRAAPTAVHFEYGTQGPCAGNPCSATTPVSAGSVDLTRLVSQEISGLQPNTIYHYRIVADNGNPDGPAFGGDMTVTTRASDAPLEHGSFAGPPGSDRAWEQVNVPDTGGNPVLGAEGVSDNGDRAVYQVAGGTPTSDTGNVYSQLAAQRTETASHAGGWQTLSIHPPREQTSSAHWIPPAAAGDLSTLIAMNESSNGSDLWRLVPGGPQTKLLADQQISDLYVSEDAARVIAGVSASLDPAHPFVPHPGVAQLYDVTSGTPRLVDLLPDQSVPSCGVKDEISAFGGGGFARRDYHWVSPDGSLVYFSSRGSGGCSTVSPSQLYVRDLVAGATTRVSPPPISGPACSAAFIKSTPGAVFFWSQSRLVAEDDSAASCDGKAGGDIYRYDLATAVVDCLTCFVPGLQTDVALPPAEAGRQIAVAGDGSRVYFMTTHHLLPGAPPEGLSAIYRVTVAGGALAFVAPGGGGTIVGDSPQTERTAISPDGSVLMFRSANTDLNALTGSDNAGSAQYYRYDDRDRSLICVSCPADGSAPAGPVPQTLLPSQPSNSPSEVSPNMTPLDAQGDVFFPTPTALVSGDHNTAGPGQDPDAGRDLYEWRDGRLLLISDGSTSWPTATNGLSGAPLLSGVSPSGHDVFFTEASQLTPDAIDGFSRLYDARVGGGFEFPVPKEPCPLEECQGVPAPTPEDPFPATFSFHGPGNPPVSPLPLPSRCGKGDVRRNGRCVPLPCPRQKVRRNGKCVSKHNNRNRKVKRHSTGRPGRRHR
jgi:hypothetical protein